MTSGQAEESLRLASQPDAPVSGLSDAVYRTAEFSVARHNPAIRRKIPHKSVATVENPHCLVFFSGYPVSLVPIHEDSLDFSTTTISHHISVLSRKTYLVYAACSSHPEIALLVREAEACSLQAFPVTVGCLLASPWRIGQSAVIIHLPQISHAIAMAIWSVFFHRRGIPPSQLHSSDFFKPVTLEVEKIHVVVHPASQIPVITQPHAAHAVCCQSASVTYTSFESTEFVTIEAT